MADRGGDRGVAEEPADGERGAGRRPGRVSLYVDTSALLKLYVEEAESDACEALLMAEPAWVTGRHTLVEVRRNLARLLHGDAHSDAAAVFAEDWQRFEAVEFDAARSIAATHHAPPRVSAAASQSVSWWRVISTGLRTASCSRTHQR